ncbi:MAG: tetratricopeptide repeat protein [Bacteroides sp.]|nr:tetratricopeptide repeat protein [Bacteroides sp.]
MNACIRILCSLLFALSFPLLVHAEDEELTHCKAQLHRALRMDNPDSIAAAYCHLSEYYAYRNSDSARYCCDQGLKYARGADRVVYMTLLINRAETFFATGELDEALSCYDFARREAIRLKHDKEDLANILASIGVIYRRKSLPDSALVYNNRALQLLEGTEAHDEQAYLLTNIAILYSHMSRLDEAESYARRAVEVAAGCEDWDMVLYAASSAGAILGLREKYGEAIPIIQSVWTRARAEHKPRFVLRCATHLLDLYQKIGQSDSVNRCMQVAEEAVRQLPEHSTEVQSYYESLYQLLARMGRHRESLNIQRRLLAKGASNVQPAIDKLYLAMAHNYVALADYRQAVDCYEEARRASDSLYSVRVSEELSDLSVKYETKEKEMQIARLNQEKLEQEARSMQWAIGAIVVLFVFLLSVCYYVWHRKQLKKEEELKVARSYIEGLERERTRLAKELHDGVCNDLLSIGLQLDCMQPTEVSKQIFQDQLEQVRSNVRFISHELMPPQFRHVTLAEALKAYVGRLIVPASMQLAFADETREAEWKQVPEQVSYEVYRIAQEWCANVIKHSGATRVEICLRIEDKRLSLLIANDGKRFSDADSRTQGIGLTTIRERTKTIAATLSVDICEGRQVFRLEVPLSYPLKTAVSEG